MTPVILDVIVSVLGFVPAVPHASICNPFHLILFRKYHISFFHGQYMFTCVNFSLSASII